MKIQCDVCDKDEASVFCVADEAALCAACDHRVHHANKLAGKHQRFSLHHPAPKQAPLCDICKERRGFLFCHQDRAILCRECDFPIHNANEHTQKHTRFLLTGVKLSATSALYSSSVSPPNSVSSDSKENKKPLRSTPASAKSTTTQSTGAPAPLSCGNSISEYLIDMLPGWHVEDFLDSSSLSSPPYGGFSKSGGDNNDLVLPFWDGDLENNSSSSNMSGFPTEKMGIWVPQVAPPPLNQSYHESVDLAFGATNGSKEQLKNSRKWSEEDTSFLVPQITPPLNAPKRFRTLW